MKIVQGDELPDIRALLHRGGTTHFRYFMEGEEGALENFSLLLSRSEGDFFSPRHRHNFEQVRFMLDGHLDFGRNGKLKKGMVGYFPEGTFYGPQSQVPTDFSLTLIMQFGGPSGSGYLSQATIDAAVEELSKIGSFKGGVFSRNAGIKGKKNLDGFTAIWEHVNQRPMLYPTPRFDNPVFMHLEGIQWLPVAGGRGVSEKLLEICPGRNIEQRVLRLDAGARHLANGHSVFVVLSGSGTAGAEPLRKYSTIHLRHDETLELTATETLEIVQFGLPVGIASRASLRSPVSEAAE
jgi:hypothetical protein